MKKIIAIIGPSASGKTALAINLAKEINGEIISVDSRQIYQGIDIGSAKPSIEQRKEIKHHLIDIINLNQEYTAANFCDDAHKIIQEIYSRGKIPILAGGTGLYFRILLQDFDLPRVAPNKELRQKLEEKSSEELYNILLNIDNESATKIHCNNKVKIIRAIEVFQTLGIPMSKAQKKKEPEFTTFWFGLNAKNREYLYNRVNQRVDSMINLGLVNEAKQLFKEYGENKVLLNTIGYQELYHFFKGQLELETSIELIKQNTRRYVKRQLSWFNANKEIFWFDIENIKTDEMINIIKQKYKIL